MQQPEIQKRTDSGIFSSSPITASIADRDFCILVCMHGQNMFVECLFLLKSLDSSVRYADVDNERDLSGVLPKYANTAVCEWSTGGYNAWRGDVGS